MKKTSLWLFCAAAACLLCVSSSCMLIKANKKAKEEIENLSYAYGAIIGKSIAEIRLNKDEKNPDKLIEGWKKGVEGDSLELADANKLIGSRMESRKESADIETAGKIAYSLGLVIIGDLAQEVKISASDFNWDVFKSAFIAAETGEPLKFKGPELDSIINAYFDPISQEYIKKMEAKKMAQVAVTINAGEDFLEKNGKRERVVTLPSGLQYLVLIEGSGPKATLKDKVKAHYHGTFIDGTVFDSSVEREQPVTRGLNAVIKGWKEGILLMSAGAKYRIFIPYELAYGIHGTGGIPAGSVLIFDIELIEIIQSEMAQADATINAGVDFLEKNVKREGVVTSPSGLQYLVLTEGNGPKATLKDKVKADFHATFVDGTVFESCHGYPVTIDLSQVIKGWQEGILLMSAGAKYRIFILQELAYGMNGVDDGIPGGPVLIYDLELIEIIRN